MRLVTWNINSVRLRFDLVKAMIAELDPDVICLQETKVVDELFPAQAFADIGYVHQAFTGMKGYNGVAILSRLPLTDIRKPERVGRQDCRHIAARVDGVDVHCLYIPAGGDIPDVNENPKFAHKLDYVREITQWAAENVKTTDPVLLCGDFNIAPLETDVWGHKQLLKVVSHTPIEVDLLNAMQNSVPFVDAMRKIVPPAEKLFTWWSYRSPDWTKNDRGRRLDHVWVTPCMADRVSQMRVLRDARAWTQPSDHVPVLVVLD